MSAFFVFAFRMLASPKLALLVIGHGSAGSASCRQVLGEATDKLKTQVEIDKAALESISDPMAYDYWLARQSRLFALAAIDVVGLSLHNPAVREVGGGVIGSPFERLLSAQGQAEFIANDICMLAFPGGPGVALIGVAPDKVGAFAAAIKQPGGRTKSCDGILAEAAKTSARAAIVVLDSCGTRQTGGGFYIKGKDRRTYALPGDYVCGGSCLEIFPYSRE